MKVTMRVEIEKKELLEIVEKHCPEVKGCKVTDISADRSGIEIEFEKDNEKPPLYVREDEKVTESNNKLPEEPEYAHVIDRFLELEWRDRVKAIHNIIAEKPMTIRDIASKLFVVKYEDINSGDRWKLTSPLQATIGANRKLFNIKEFIRDDGNRKMALWEIAKEYTDKKTDEETEQKAPEAEQEAPSTEQDPTITEQNAPSTEQEAPKKKKKVCRECGINKPDGTQATLCYQCRCKRMKEAAEARKEKLKKENIEALKNIDSDDHLSQSSEEASQPIASDDEPEKEIVEKTTIPTKEEVQKAPEEPVETMSYEEIVSEHKTPPPKKKDDKFILLKAMMHRRYLHGSGQDVIIQYTDIKKFCEAAGIDPKKFILDLADSDEYHMEVQKATGFNFKLEIDQLILIEKRDG